MNKLDPNKYVVVTTDKDHHVLFLSGNDGHTAPAFMPLSDNVIQFRNHEDAAHASKSMWENYHNGGTIWKVDHLYLDPYYKDPMHNGVCKMNNFSQRLNKLFSFDINSVIYDIANSCLEEKINSKQFEWFKDFITLSNEWNLSKGFVDSPEGKTWTKKVVEAWKSVGKDIFYDYILTDDYFIYVIDTKVYNKYIDKVYPGDKAYTFDSNINYYVSGVWKGQFTDLQGSGITAEEAIDKYNDNCNEYFRLGDLKVVHPWKGKSAKGKIKLPPKVTPENVINNKYNFSERLMKCFSFDSYMTLYPEFVTKLLAKGPKVAEITTKETDIDLGNGFGWNLEKGTLIIHVNGSNYYFGPRYKKSDSEVKRVKNLDGSTDVLNVPKSGAKPYEYFGFLSAYDGNPYRKLTEFFKSLNLGFWGGCSADEDEYSDYQKANGDKSKFINQYDPKYRKHAELRWDELSKLGWIQTYDH